MGIQVKPRVTIVALGALCISTLYACGGGGSGGSGSSSGSGTSSSTSSSSSSGGSVSQDNLNQSQTLASRLAAAIVLDDGVEVGTATFPKGATVSGGQGQLVEGLVCVKPAQSSPAYVYTHLNLVVDGQPIAVPDNIGQVSQGNPAIADPVVRETGCAYPVLTSDASGKIRIQAGSALPYTLGQFFALWGQPLTDANVAGYTGRTVKVFIRDGAVLTEYSGSLATVPLTPNREITVQIGSVLAEIPNFEWNNPPPLSAAPIVVKRNAIEPSNGQAGLEDNLFNNKGGQGSPVDGLTCYGPRNQNELTELYHVHSHLAIYKDGVRLAVPPFLGIVGNDTVANTFCIYPLHTHDSTGTIHVEPVDNNPVTLGQFFKIWGQPLTRTNVAGQTGEAVVVYLNDGGNLRKYQGDLASIELKSNRSIVIQVGTPLTQIPTFDLADEVQ